jgi:HemY protein
LKAQAAQLSGDRNTARRLYEAMLENPETEVAGLRGLYLEARREKEMEAARQFAQKAQERNPRLGWANQALLEIQSRSGQWADALKTLELSRKFKKIDKHSYVRQRAVLLTAMALENEDGDMDMALEQALEAHKLAPDLVPAADVAGRILAAQGNVRKASKIISATWEMSPHPDLALTYAHARPGDSPRDRLARVKQLAVRSPHSPEGPIAVATAAIESHDWDEARNALRELVKDRPSQRVCELMARIEGGEFGDKGRVREWLARNTRAPRDPVWIADGYISPHWAPLSPITGQLDAFRWKAPTEQFGAGRDELPFEEFIPLQAEQAASDISEESGAAAGAIVPVAAAAASNIAPETAGRESESAGDGHADSAPVSKTDMGEKDAAATPGAMSEEAKAEGEARDNEIEDAEIIEDGDPGRARGEGKKGRKARPEIYIPPRMPDDPGPLGPSGPRRDQKLPQRFRQSRS